MAAMNSRALTSLTLQLTTRCNLRCVHCYSPPKGGRLDPDIPTDVALGIIEDAADLGLSRIAILGGEPLIRRDLETLVARAVSVGLDPDVVTNGLLLSEERITSLVASGIRHLTVSIDGLRPGHNLMRGRDNFDRTLASVDRIRARGLEVKVNTVVTRLNRDELPKLTEQLQSRCDIHKLIFYTPTGPAGSDIWVSPEEWIPMAAELTARHRSGGSRLLVQQPFEAHPSKKACRLSAPFIAADGQVMPCVTLVESPRSVGSVLERSFRDIWTGSWAIRDVHDHCIGYSQILTGDIAGDFRPLLPMADWQLACPLFCTREAPGL